MNVRPAETRSAHAGALYLPLALAAGAAVVLGALGVLPRWPGLVHAVALPPLDLAFDLRVLAARAPSYAVFAAGLVASLAVRSAALGGLLAAWRGTSFRAGFVLALRFYLVAAPPLALAAGLAFAGLAAVYHWYFWAGLGLTVLTALLLGPAPLAGHGSLRAGIASAARRGFRAGTVLGYLAALAAIGALARGMGPWGAVGLVPASAALTYAAVHRLSRPARRRRLPAAATVLSLVLLGAARPVVPAPASPGTVLFLVPGVATATGEGTLYGLDPGTLGFGCGRVFYFSYRGPGAGGPQGSARCPVRLHAPYGKADTQVSLDLLVDAFSRQLSVVREEARGARVVVVTHSQGAWIAWGALARRRAPGVSHLVMLSGFPATAVGYPPPGRGGAGRVGGDALRALSAAAEGLGSSSFDPDAPLARELMARSGALQRLFAAPLPPGVRALSVFASFDLPVAPRGWRPPGAQGVMVDTIHVGVVRSPAAAAAVRRFLAGADPGGATVLGRVVEASLPAFGVPPG